MSDLLLRDMLPARVCPTCLGAGSINGPRERYQQCPTCDGTPVVIVGPNAGVGQQESNP